VDWATCAMERSSGAFGDRVKVSGAQRVGGGPAFSRGIRFPVLQRENLSVPQRLILAISS